MLTFLFFTIVGTIIGLIAFPLSFIPFPFPVEIVNAFGLFFTTLHYLAGIIPFLPAAIGVILVLLPAKYIRILFDMLRWIFALIPVFGKHVPHPLTGHALDLRGNASNGALDLRRGPVKTRRTMRDIRKP